MKLRNQFTDNQNEINQLRKAIGTDSEISLIKNVENISVQSKEFSRHFDNNTKEIITALYNSNDIMKEKFNEFAELLAKNNTQILVDAIQNVIGEFNNKLARLIERLVKENFEELNRSVQRLNDWQKKTKNKYRV